MSAEVLYRKWRPKSFSEIAGQDVIVRTLTNAVAGGKVAHAYLFTGPRGTGKTTTGRLLAKALNCTSQKDGEPCNECDSCLSYIEGRALDLVELDAASNRGIDEIRNLREKANFAPAAGPYKLYLVDEVHMLTEPAFNALLKTLEEPPPHIIFVLATTEIHKVPQTVISRCQRFDFRRIPLDAIVDRLTYVAEQEEIECPREGLAVIARTATGSARDAMNLLEQLAASNDKKLTLDSVREGLDLVVDERSAQLSGHALREELAEGLGLIASVRDDGIDLRQFQRQVIAYLRGLLLVKAGAPPSDAWSDEQLAEMRTVVANVTTVRIIGTLRAFGEADLRADPLSPLPLELALAESVLTPAEASKEPPPAAERTAAPQRAAAEKPPPPPKPVRAASKPEEKPAKKQEKAPAPPAEEAKTANGAAEQPAPAAEKTDVSDAGESPLLTSARSHWDEIYRRTREIDFKTGALLNSGCDIIQATETEIVFGFRHGWLLDKIQSSDGENQHALQQAVDEVLGQGHKVRCVLEPSVHGRQSAKSGHLVRAAEEMGGKVIADDG